MKRQSIIKSLMFSVSIPFMLMGCATVSIADVESASMEASFGMQTSLERASNAHIRRAKGIGLASKQSGFEFLSQVLLRGTDSVMSGYDRYVERDGAPLQRRVVEDSEKLVESLTEVSNQARDMILNAERIRRKDVVAFESAIIVTDEAHRTFERCIELNQSLETDSVLSSLETLQRSADTARRVADDLAAAYSGEETDAGS